MKLILLPSDLLRQLKEFARRLPNEVWDRFEPRWPPRNWCGNGRPPKPTREGFHALRSVRVTGLPWERVPGGVPAYKPGHRRVAHWVALAVCHPAWQQLAERYPGLRSELSLLPLPLSTDGVAPPAAS